MGDVTPFRWPWELAERSTADTVRLIQQDMAYMVTHTAVKVHSNRPELCALVNTPRGQIIPRNAATFADGTTLEFLDIGMPQPGAKVMTVPELIDWLVREISNMGLDVT